MARVTIYRNYRFIDKDPICDALRTMIRGNEHLKNHQVHQIAGVASGTIEGWLDGATKRPQNATVTQVSAALGYVRSDDLTSDGSVIVGFRKARAYAGDWNREIEKQANFLLKFGKKTKPKRNGGNK